MPAFPLLQPADLTEILPFGELETLRNGARHIGGLQQERRTGRNATCPPSSGKLSLDPTLHV